MTQSISQTDQVVSHHQALDHIDETKHSPRSLKVICTTMIVVPMALFIIGYLGKQEIVPQLKPIAVLIGELKELLTLHLTVTSIILVYVKLREKGFLG